MQYLAEVCQIQRWFVLKPMGAYRRPTQQYHRRRLGTPLPQTRRTLPALRGFPTFLSTNIPHSCRPIQIGTPYSCLHFPDTIRGRDCHLLPRFPLPRFQSPRVCHRSCWSLYDVNRSTFDEDIREKRL